MIIAGIGRDFIRFASAALVVGLLALAPAAHAVDTNAAAREFAQHRPQPAKTVSSVAGWQGNDSAISEPGVLRIADREAWNELWTKHAPGTSAPNIDFSKFMAIAVFAGKVPGSVSELTLYGVTEDSGIELVTNNFVNDVMSNETTSPYVIVALPRSAKPVTVLARSYAIMRKPQLQITTIAEIGPLPGAR